MFYRVMKYGYDFGAYELNHECASTHVPERVPIFYRYKTQAQMFYFDSDTIVPLQRVALVFWKSYAVVWLTVPWDPNNISSRCLLN